MNKQGRLGLEYARYTIGMLLILGVIAIVVFAVLVSMQTASTNIITPLTATVTNESGGYINATGYTLGQAGVTGFASPAITAAYNVTDGSLIGAGNYSVSAAGVVTNASVTNWATVNFTYSYTYSGANTINVNSLTGNTTAGVTTFFSYVPTWMVLLAVVVLIAIVAIIIFAVSKFENRRSSVI